jgi:hypothetical protein
MHIISKDIIRIDILSYLAYLDVTQVDDSFWDVVVDVNKEVIHDDKLSHTQELLLLQGPPSSLAGFIRNLGVSVRV